MRLRNMDYLLNFKLKLKTEFTHKWQFLNTPFPNQFKILQSWGKGNNDCKPHWDLINSMPKLKFADARKKGDNSIRRVHV